MHLETLLQLKTPTPRRRKALRWAAWLLFGYTVFGFIILPLIVRPVAAARLTRELNREVSIQKVRLNPYALSCTVRGLLIKDLDGEPFVSWDKVYVNFQLSSFLGRPWVFKEVSGTNVFLRAQLNKDYTFNFSDLIEKFAKPSEPPKPSKPLALRVGRLAFSGTRVSVTDLTPSQRFRRVIGPLSVNLNNFHTHPDNRNPHSFTGSTDAGEVFAWKGFFSLDPIRAEGELSVDHVALNKFAPWYQDLMRFEIKDGVASVQAAYKFASSPSALVAEFTNVSVALNSFKVSQSGATESMVDLETFRLRGMSGDLVNRRFEINSLSVTGAVLGVHRSPDASINMLEAAKPAVTGTNMPGGVVMLLRAVTNVKNLSNRPGSNLTATASLRWNTNGVMKSEVTASVIPLAADARLFCDQIDLAPLDPYLEPYLYLFITDRFSTKGCS